jgi:hypothetical protein
MKSLWKALAALPFLALALWWIHSDAEEPRVSAVPLASPAGQPGAAGPAAAGDSSWRRAALWDDGKAEFCAYEVSWAHYGHRYDGRALLILVKEPWNADLEVKADTPRRPEQGGFEVLKLNHVRDVPTGIYTYHQMASLFWRRDSGALEKAAATSSEACGISTAEVLHGRLETRSYFDGQGDRGQAWPAGAIPEDGLPAALRDYVDAPPPATLSVFPSLMTGRFGSLAPATYHVGKRVVDAPGGAAGTVGAIGAVEIALTAGTSNLAYTFEKQPPHRLLRFARDDGTLYRLAKCDRLEYWNMHDPGGESWLPPAVR